MSNEIALRPSCWASVSGGKDSLYLLSKYKAKNVDKCTTIYYAHSIFKYNTPIEEYEMSLIPGHIVNPNGAVDQTKNEKEIMQHCFRLIEKCDSLAFSSLEGVIGKGVADEVLYAFANNKAVYYIHNNKLNRIKEITIKPIVGSKTRRIYATFDYTEVE